MSAYRESDGSAPKPAARILWRPWMGRLSIVLGWLAMPAAWAASFFLGRNIGVLIVGGIHVGICSIVSLIYALDPSSRMHHEVRPPVFLKIAWAPLYYPGAWTAHIVRWIIRGDS